MRVTLTMLTVLKRDVAACCGVRREVQTCHERKDSQSYKGATGEADLFPDAEGCGAPSFGTESRGEVISCRTYRPDEFRIISRGR